LSNAVAFIREQISLRYRPSHNPYKIVFPGHYSTVGGASFFVEKRYINNKRKECPMMFVLAAVVVLLLLALAGADLFVSQYNPDELSKMGVQEQ